MTDAIVEPAIATPPGPGTARAVVLFALIGLFAYFNSLHGDYVLDDHRFTIDPKIGRPFESSMAPRPAIAVSLAINYWIDGLNPRGYHAMNLAVHVFAALILFDLVRRTLLMPRFAGRFEASAGWIGLVCGLIWLVHPLNTQSVTYVIQRCESFMGMFFLASLWCYLRGATAERGLWWYLLGFVACTLGAGCKEMMITLIPLAWLYDRTFLTGSWRESLRKRWWVLVLLAIPPIAGLMALVLTGFFTDSEGTVGFGVKVFTPYTYLLTQSEVILHYLRLSVYPVGQAIDYLDWKPCTSIQDCWLSFAAITALLGITVVGVWRQAAWAFPAAWFFVILAPSSSFVPVQDAAFEHRMYLPLIGVVVLIVCGIAWAGLRFQFASGRALGVVAGAVIFVLGLMTASRNEDYSSSTRLLADNAERRPANGRVQLNLAVNLFAGGDVKGAEEHLNAALALPLQLPNLRIEKTKVLRESGRPAEAVLVAQQLLAELPDSPEAPFELGLSLLADGRKEDAVPYLKLAAEKTPGSKFARLHYGVALLEIGQTAMAETEFRAARDLDPNYSAMLVQTARRVALDPDAKPSHLRLAVWYAAAACRMTDSPTVECLDAHAIALARSGRYPEAAKEDARAADLARARGDSYLASRIDARTALFRAGKPYLPEPRKE